MLSDTYIIKKTRSKDLALEFLDYFLPNRSESQIGYQIPWGSENPHVVYDSSDHIMRYLETNVNYYYPLYWRNIDEESKNKHGMIFYTNDGCMIFGISRYGNDIKDISNELECLNDMKLFLNTDDGYITYECPPEENFYSFIKAVEAFKKGFESNRI